MAKIKQVTAREILNAAGLPTIETTISLNDGSIGVASVPSSIDKSIYEAVEIKDKDPLRYKGLGVQKAIQNIQNIIAPQIIGMDVDKQREIDKKMIEIDGTQNKSKLGTNSILSVSIATSKAAAASSVMPVFLYLRQFTNNQIRIPTPIFSCINGGVLSPNTFDFQEFLFLPASSSPFTNGLEMAMEIYNSVVETLKINGQSVLTTTKGGFSPRLSSNYDALSFISQAIETTNKRLGFDVFLGINASPNYFYRNSQYHIKDKSQNLTAKSLNDYYLELNKQYHILYFEDTCAEDDWDGWIDSISKLSTEAVVAGAKLIATNPYRLQMAIDKKACSAVVITPGQIGTVIEAIAVAEMARTAGLKIIVATRDIETNDDFIADFAVAIGADYCKFGALNREEHVKKYNRLSQIQEKLNALKQ